MSRPAVTVPDHVSIAEVLATMKQHQVRRVPVVDRDGRCVGIISEVRRTIAVPQPATCAVRDAGTHRSEGYRGEA
jgi:acetoin utilization protein AcuB